MAGGREQRVPEDVDVTHPSIARIYDYLLFGKDNFEVDRAAARKLMESRLDPSPSSWTWAADCRPRRACMKSRGT